MNRLRIEIMCNEFVCWGGLTQKYKYIDKSFYIGNKSPLKNKEKYGYIILNKRLEKYYEN